MAVVTAQIRDNESITAYEEIIIQGISLGYDAVVGTSGPQQLIINGSSALSYNVYGCKFDNSGASETRTWEHLASGNLSGGDDTVLSGTSDVSYLVDLRIFNRFSSSQTLDGVYIKQT